METITSLSVEEIKSSLQEQVKSYDPCASEYRRFLEANTIGDLLTVFKYNMAWLLKNDVLNAEKLEKLFEKVDLLAAHIYTSGIHSITLENSVAIAIVTLGNSQATVETRDNSYATVETRDNSQATVKTLGNSQATVETLDNSQATVETFGNSHATVETFGNSHAPVKTRGNSQATVKTRGNSQATVETRDNSQATVETFDNSLLRHLTERKIYVRKSAFEIIQIAE